MSRELETALVEKFGIKDIDSLLTRLDERKQSAYSEKIRQIAASIPESTSKSLSELSKRLDLPDREAILKGLGAAGDSAPTLERDATEATKGAVTETPDLVRAAVEKMGPAAGMAAVATELKAGMAEVAKADGAAKIEKSLSLFERMSSSVERFFDSVKIWFATAFPAIAKFFGIEAPKKPESEKLPGSAAALHDETGADKEKEAKPKASPLSDESFNAYKEELKTRLSRQLGIDFSDPKRIDALNRVLAKYRNELKNLGKDVVETGTFSFVGLGFETTSMALAFTFELVSEGVIPVEAVAMDIASTGFGVVKIGLTAIGKLAGSGEKIDLWEFSVSALGEAVGKLSKEQQEVLAAIVYRKGGIITALLGQAGYVVSRLALTSLYVGEDISSIKMSFGALTGRYESVLHNFNKMSEVLGNSKAAGEFSKQLSTIIESAKEKSLVMSAYSKHPNDAAKFAETVAKLSGETKVSGQFIESVKAAAAAGKLPSDRLGMAISELWKPHNFSETLSAWEKGKSGVLKGNYLRGAFASADFALDDFAKRMTTLETGMHKTLQSGNAGLRLLQNFKNSFKISDMPRGFENALFATTKDEAMAMARQLRFMATQSPELVRGILGHLPIIAVAGIAASKDDPFIAEFAKELRFLIPFYGPFLIMRDAWLKEWKPENVLSLWVGWGLLMIDVYGGIKAFQKGELLKFMARPYTDLASITRGSIETVLALGQTSKLMFQALRAGKFTEALSYFKPANLGRNAAVAGTIAVLGYVAYDSFFKENPEEILADLEKKGFLLPNGWFNTEKILKEFAYLKAEQKEQVLTFVANSTLHDEAIFATEKAPGSETPDLSGVKVKGETATIAFGHLPSLSDKDAVERAFSQFWMRTAFEFATGPLERHAEMLKSELTRKSGMKEGQLLAEFLALTDAYGIPRNYAEKVWRKA